MERRKFTREFKIEAVKLIQERGVTVAQAARELGVQGSVLRRWVQESAANAQQAFPGQGQMKPEQAASSGALATMVLLALGAVAAIGALRIRRPAAWALAGALLAAGSLYGYVDLTRSTSVYLKYMIHSMRNPA